MGIRDVLFNDGIKFTHNYGENYCWLPDRQHSQMGRHWRFLEDKETYSSSCLWEIWDSLGEFQGSELVGEENGHPKFPSELVEEENGHPK